MKDSHMYLNSLLYGILILSLLFGLTHGQVGSVRRTTLKGSSLPESNKQGIYAVAAIAGGSGAILGAYYLIKRNQRLNARKNAISRLHQHYNSKGQTSISQQWFSNWFSDFQDILKDVVHKRKSFIFRKAEQDHVSLLVSYEFQKMNEFSFSLLIKGVDEGGEWQGEGEFTMTAQGPLFWMVKCYFDAQRVDPRGEHEILVFESAEMNQRQVKGKWFLEGSEGSEGGQGSWMIMNKDPGQE